MIGEVDVLGQVDYLEVWNHERFLAKLQRDPFTTTTPARSRSSGSEPWHEPVLVDEVVTLLAPRADGRLCRLHGGLRRSHPGVLAAGAGRVIGIDRDARHSSRRASGLADRTDRVVLVHDALRRIGDVLAARGVRRSTACWLTLECRRCSSISGSRLQFSTGRTARHADGSVPRRDAGREAGRRRRHDPRRPHLAVRRGATVASRGAVRSSRPAIRAPRRHVQHSPPSCDGPSARGSGSGWIRRRARFRRCGSGSTDEMDGLRAFVESAWRGSHVGGRLAIIAFHSLEDRVVKHTFRRLAEDGTTARLLTKRPLVASDVECERNPRARSARLRGLERVA